MALLAAHAAGRVRRIAGGSMAWPAVLAALAALLAVACASALWITSLPGVDLRRMNDIGLVSVLPLATYAALALLTISFCVLVHQRQAYVPLLLLHVVLLIAIIHGTPAILYGTLRYSWAWKHVGIVDYIQRHGSVNPNISYMNAYHNWPGFFALGALLTEVAGFNSALSFASWAPLFFNLIDLGALLLILRACTTDRRLIWLSVWFFYLTNWVGQDYFSPQAMAYFLHLVILGICLRWFRGPTRASWPALNRWRVFARPASLLRRAIDDRPASLRFVLRDDRPRPFQRVGLIGMVLLLFAVIASSHQLTPFMTILAVTALVVFRRCSARGLPTVMIVLTVAWIVYMAEAFLRGNLYWIVESIGQAGRNANANLIDLSHVSAGMKVVAFMSRALTATLWGLAVLGCIGRLRRGYRYRDWPMLLLAIAPFPMLASNSYSGEMLFRVYLFALPFMAFFAAALLYPAPTAGTTRRTLAATVALSGLLLVGLCFAYYGKERMYYFSRDEVAAATYLYDVAPAGSLLLDGTWNHPSAFRNYEQYTYTSLVLQPSGSPVPLRQQAALRAHPAAVIADLMANSRYRASYLIITRSQKADVDMMGWMPAGSLDRIERALEQSRQFRVIYANRDATIFTLAPKGAGQ